MYIFLYLIWDSSGQRHHMTYIPNTKCSSTTVFLFLALITRFLPFSSQLFWQITWGEVTILRSYKTAGYYGCSSITDTLMSHARANFGKDILICLIFYTRLKTRNHWMELSYFWRIWVRNTLFQRNVLFDCFCLPSTHKTQ